MRKILCAVGMFGLVCLGAAPVQASVIDLVGDKDCFGLGGSCPDGTLWRDELGGVFFTNYQDPGDPSFTDVWSVPASVSYSHDYTLDGPATSASLQVRIAGIHDVNLATVYSVLFNGVSIGAIPPQPDQFQRVTTYTFVVPTSLLTGSDSVSWATGGADGFSVDFSELSIITAVAATPEPASLLLFGLAAAAGFRSRRRRA